MSDQKRREISFASLDDVIADIESLASREHETTGNHSFGNIVQHLAITNEMLVGNVIPPKLPWYMRMAMPFLKNGILNNPVEPGFNLPNSAMQKFFWPSTELDLNEAIENFRASVKAYQDKGPLPVHPVFGKATKQQIDKMNLSHAAMHLSFVHPK